MKLIKTTPRLESKEKAKKIIFKTHDLGVPLDNLTRDDYYDLILFDCLTLAAEGPRIPFIRL